MLVRPRHFLLLAILALLSINAFAQNPMDPLKDLDFSKSSLKHLVLGYVDNHVEVTSRATLSAGFAFSSNA